MRTIRQEDYFGEVTAAYRTYIAYPLGGTLDRWMPEIWAYFETGTTNAATEGCNRKVKQVKRVSPAASATTTTTSSE